MLKMVIGGFIASFLAIAAGEYFFPTTTNYVYETIIVAPARAVRQLARQEHREERKSRE